jgi:hypothetical protein
VRARLRHRRGLDQGAARGAGAARSRLGSIAGVR